MKSKILQIAILLTVMASASSVFARSSSTTTPPVLPGKGAKAAEARPNVRRCFRWNIWLGSPETGYYNIVSDWSCFTVTYYPRMIPTPGADPVDAPITDMYVSKAEQKATFIFSPDADIPAGATLQITKDSGVSPDGVPYPDGYGVSKVVLLQGEYPIVDHKAVVSAIVQ